MFLVGFLRMMFFESLEGFFLHSFGIWEAASYPTRSRCSEIPPRAHRMLQDPLFP